MPRISHSEGLADYLAMGEDRSLAKLHDRYASEHPEGVPALETLKSWSKKHGWQAVAVQFDKDARARLVSRTRNMVVERQFDRVAALAEAAQACLEDANAMRIVGEGTAAEKKALITAAIDAIKMVEVLTGGVSDRQERVAGMADEAKRALQQLEEQKRRGKLIDARPSSVLVEPIPKTLEASKV
jgi:hypothetical protein